MKRDGTWQYQTTDSFVMEWDQMKFRRMVPWDRRTNTGRMRSAPTMKQCRAFAAVYDQQQECCKHDHVAYPVHVILDDRTEASGERIQAQMTLGGEKNNPPTIYKEDEENLTDFFEEKQGPTIILDDESEKLAAAIPQAYLLIWHYLMGHTSFAKLKLMAALGILQEDLPLCSPQSVQGVYLEQ
jgi:hypothetical protein